jgi:hypothetical protein
MRTIRYDKPRFVRIESECSLANPKFEFNLLRLRSRSNIKNKGEKLMKKVFTCILALVLGLSMFACASTTPAASAPAATEAPAAATEAAATEAATAAPLAATSEFRCDAVERTLDQRRQHDEGNPRSEGLHR